MRIDEQLARGRQIRDRDISDPETLARANRDYWTWIEYNRELLRKLLTTSEVSDEFGASARMIYSMGPTSFAQDLDDFRKDIGTHLRRLESIHERLPLYKAEALQGTVDQREGDLKVDPKRVFVVHGHELKSVDRVVRLLRDLELQPVVLREQPNAGRTIIEKFEAHADVTYAVVLMTGDDVGGPRQYEPGQLAPRARQNVVLELGFFIGRLTRRMVAALVEPDVELPSDIEGVLYIPFDPGDMWRLRLAKEMKAAGLPVDMNKL